LPSIFLKGAAISRVGTLMLKVRAAQRSSIGSLPQEMPSWRASMPATSIS
jgi:hypothetical protein